MVRPVSEVEVNQIQHLGLAGRQGGREEREACNAATDTQVERTCMDC